jgi:hypothetical protein
VDSRANFRSRIVFHQNKEYLLNLSNIHLPRELEADDSAMAIHCMLTARTAKIWPGGTNEATVISMSDPLKQALVKARLKGQIRCGFEAIRERLESEKKGIMNIRRQSAAPYGNRISRLILFSDDGAERLYRHIEQLIQDHSPRVLGCLLDIDSSVLGHLMTGKDMQIKVLMAEHKEAVSELLRAMMAGPTHPDL